MITFIGFLLLGYALFSFAWKKTEETQNERIKAANEYNKKVDEYNVGKQSYDQKPGKSVPSKLPNLSSKFKSRYIVLAGIGVLLLNGLFFWNDAGTITAVQFPWGGDKMITTQGVKIKGWGRTIPLSYEISIRDMILSKYPDGSPAESLPDTERGIYNRSAKKWEFSDAIKADIATAIVIEILTDDDSTFLAMADRNRSEAKLINGRVLPNIDAALKNTCKLMDAQDYISGAASKFDLYFRDQLQNGMYIVEEYYETEKLPQIIGDSTSVRTVGVLSDVQEGQGVSKQKKYRIKYNSQGDILRDNTSNSLSQYGIKFIQAQVTSIDWEKSFDTRLDEQKDEVAKTQLEKQQAERQYYTAKKNEAEAESNKVQRRGELELQQIEKTIAAETKAKAAKYKEEEEKNLLAAASDESKRIKILADAEAYKNHKLVISGLTPQERRTMDETMNKDKWSNVAKMQFNGVYIMDGGASSKSSGDGLLSALLGAEVAKNMNSKKK